MNERRYIYLLYTIILKLTIIQCQPLIPEKEAMNECYMRKDQSNVNTSTHNQYEACPGDNDPIELHFIPGNLKGSVVAEFILAPPHCLQIAYEIELQHDIGDHENKTCKGASPTSPISHSEKRFSIFPCNGNCTNTCGKYGRIQFLNVIPGCYRAKVKQFGRPQIFKNRETNWTYIGEHKSETSVVKIDIDDVITHSQGVNISVAFSKPSSYVIVELLNAKKIKKMDMNELLNSECDFFKSESYSGNITKYDGLSCSLTYLSENYSMIKVNVFKDEQCDNEMKYNTKPYLEKEACWEIETRGVPLTLNHDRITMVRANDWTLLGIIVSLFIIILMVVCVIYKLLLRRKKARSLPSREESSKLVPESMNNDYEILLLYAKDCKEFMVTMESFRQMLGEVCNVKVYDCFDEPSWEDEQISPHNWLEKIIKLKPSLHIILVSTSSACIQYNGFLSGAYNGYVSAFKDPSYLDKIFLYGLRIVKDYEITNHAYGKIFIIELKGFSDPTDSEELSSLSRVYQIPIHLYLLIRDMIKASSKKVFHEEDDFEMKFSRTEINNEKCNNGLINFTASENYHKFLYHLEKLKDFKRNNQNYLSDILQPTFLNQNINRDNK